MDIDDEAAGDTLDDAELVIVTDSDEVPDGLDDCDTVGACVADTVVDVEIEAVHDGLANTELDTDCVATIDDVTDIVAGFDGDTETDAAFDGDTETDAASDGDVDTDAATYDGATDGVPVDEKLVVTTTRTGAGWPTMACAGE